MIVEFDGPIELPLDPHILVPSQFTLQDYTKAQEGLTRAYRSQFSVLYRGILHRSLQDGIGERE